MITPINDQEPALASSQRPPASIDLRLLTRVKPLPVLPDGAPVLLNILSDATLPFEKLADALGKFPTIAARLLSLANSPWSSPASPVTTLDSAVARLGLETARSVSIALTISAPFNPIRCASFDAHRHWTSAMLAAHAASRLVSTLQSNFTLSPPTARVAGLMHNLGLLWLADALPQEMDHAFSIAGQDPMMSVNDALLSSCGFSYSQAGAALSETWHIPQPIAAGMACHLPATIGSTEEEMARLIRLVTGMISSLFNESLHGVDPTTDEYSIIDADAYQWAYDDLAATLPAIQELAAMLFVRSNRPVD